MCYEDVEAAQVDAIEEWPGVLIVGSGPIGATFARTLVNGGVKVLMIDIGEQGTRRVGDHHKNSVAVQKDISLFTNTVKGELSLLSVPVDKQGAPYLEPISWDAKPLQFVHNGQNPHQLAWDNLPVAAASRVVGGMGSHWTCCTPEELPGIERSTLYSDGEWSRLYARAKELFSTNSTSFDNSIRHQLVKHVLAGAFPNRQFTGMPLACKRNSRGNRNYIEWSCAATILGDLSEPGYRGDSFEIRPNYQCIKLQRDDLTGQVAWVVVRDLLTDKVYHIRAKKYVICAGAVLTPGILVNSGFDQRSNRVLGRYMTEQTMAFCQVVLKRTLVDEVPKDPYDLGWTKIVERHWKTHPEDPLPFPFNDPDPQVYTPLSKEHPWHTQIHRDAFGYGGVPEAIDQRLVVDFRWFGYVKPVKENWIEFVPGQVDGFGMPQPTFHYRVDPDDARRTQDMMQDMVTVATRLGGFLPGAEPKYLPPGSALHICGTYRAGESDKDSVVDKHSKVWGQKDLYLGGCGVIPTQNACNPTLTAACFALVAAEHLIHSLRGP